MSMNKFIVTAVGEGRMDIVSRISMLYLQRHIKVESLVFKPAEDGQSSYEVVAYADEQTIRRLMGQMFHVEGLQYIDYEILNK